MLEQVNTLRARPRKSWRSCELIARIVFHVKGSWRPVASVAHGDLQHQHSKYIAANPRPGLQQSEEWHADGRPAAHPCASSDGGRRQLAALSSLPGRDQRARRID
jgi:hypothetical protein